MEYTNGSILHRYMCDDHSMYDPPTCVLHVSMVSNMGQSAVAGATLVSCFGTTSFFCCIYRTHLALPPDDASCEPGPSYEILTRAGYGSKSYSKRCKIAP